MLESRYRPNDTCRHSPPVFVRHRALPILALLGLASATHALEWSSTDVQLLSGSGFALGASRRHTLTFEHASGWKYGDNYFFVDLVEHDGNDDPVNTEFYGEWYPRLSLGKMTGTELSFGIVSDVSLAGGINLGSQPSDDPFKAYLGGVSFNFNVPGVRFLQVDVLAYHADGVDSTGVQITPIWDMPFDIGPASLTFRGFFDYVSAEATGGSYFVLAQPQLLLDVGKIAGFKDTLYAGVEYWYWHNKFGIKGVTDRAPQAMVMWKF